jgi:hypothetical protein
MQSRIEVWRWVPVTPSSGTFVWEQVYAGESLVRGLAVALQEKRRNPRGCVKIEWR